MDVLRFFSEKVCGDYFRNGIGGSARNDHFVKIIKSLNKETIIFLPVKREGRLL